MASQLIIYTIGHSTLSFEAFVQRLDAFEIRLLADIRSYPGSRRLPQFNRDALASALPEHGIEYAWLPALGGRRSSGLGEASPNRAWRHPSFRNYADYMMTPPFAAGIQDLLERAARTRTAIMCAEALWWRCHRRLVSDYLLARGIAVQHIMTAGESKPHVLSPSAQIREDGLLEYPADPLFSSAPAPSRPDA